jgi:glycosyltransferase involved in cell wall biosynthesis
MRVAVDAHAIGRHLTGNEVYVRSLLEEFARQTHAGDFVVYVAGEQARASVPAGMCARMVAANPFVRLGAELALKLRADAPDLVHVQYTAPMGCPVPVVVSVHDVSYLEHPEYFPAWRARQLQFTVGRTVRRAARILTVSEFSRAAILRAYGDLDEDRVVVVSNAASPEFRPRPREMAAEAVRGRFGIAAPIVLTVGDLLPRKNQVGLIEAFARLVRACPQLKHHLVVAGQETWFARQVRQAAAHSGVGERIHFPGFVSDAEMLSLYGACDAFVFPSFYEGFGLPPLEAMACGRAVACADVSALPEVVDGAAILFDPYDVDEIARAMKDLLVDAELRARMERLGLQRAARFSWKQSAAETLDVFRQVAGESALARAGAKAMVANR